LKKKPRNFIARDLFSAKYKNVLLDLKKEKEVIKEKRKLV